MLDLREKYHNFVENSFDRNRNFTRKLKEAFELFINRDMRAAQYLSLYIDEMMKKGLKGVSDAEINDRLQNVKYSSLFFFRCIFLFKFFWVL